MLVSALFGGAASPVVLCASLPAAWGALAANAVVDMMTKFQTDETVRNKFLQM